VDDVLKVDGKWGSLMGLLMGGLRRPVR